MPGKVNCNYRPETQVSDAKQSTCLAPADTLSECIDEEAFTDPSSSSHANAY